MEWRNKNKERKAVPTPDLCFPLFVVSLLSPSLGVDYSAISIMSKYIRRVCSSSSFFVRCKNPFFS